MNQIKFSKSANIFLNTGIVALCYYLQKSRENSETTYAFDFKLTEEELVVESEQLFTLLEDVYYLMGKEVYDTATNKQLQDGGNLYYIEKEEKFIRFPKMNTYGLTTLLTNNAQGTTIKESNTKKLSALEKSNPEQAERIKNEFDRQGLKLLSKIYFNEPYTKITRLDPLKADFFKEGSQVCYLTGESYKKLIDIQNTSPFVSGIINFNSYLNAGDKKISWKAMYLSRFAPALSFYKYLNKIRDSLVVYFFNSDNLQHLNKIYLENKLHKDRLQLLEDEFLCNISLSKFSDNWKDFYTGQYDSLFMLLYTFYTRALKSQLTNLGLKSAEANPFEESGFKNIPISLVYFRADQFAATMRPNAFEELNNFKFLIRMIYYLEKKRIDFSAIFRGLLLLKPSLRGKKNSMQLERQFRDKVLGKLIRTRPIIQEMESLFFDCFRYTMSNENVGFKNYKQLLLLLNLYEPIVKYGGNKYMNPELQQRAINLGKSIGQGILNHDSSQSKTANAKQGRAYIIAIRKARTLTHFLDELMRIQFKFGNSVSNDILQEIKQENFVYIKQFATISALNQLNSALHSSNNTQNNEKE
jgi:hypothetical protein